MIDNYEQYLLEIKKDGTDCQTFNDVLLLVRSITRKEIKNLIICYFNYNIIQRYGNWEKYPRKIKKMLKNKKMWQFRNCEPLNYNDVQIEFTN